MTATPKEEYNISTSTYFGDPLYTYSLKQGIEDGFLAPYKVLKIGLNRDLMGWRPELGKTDKFGNEIEDKQYTQSDFDRTLVLEKRTKEVAKRVMQFQRENDPYAKTIVFCENIDHADRMRAALCQEAQEFVKENPKYIMKITGDDMLGKAELDNFIDLDSRYPVIAVMLLSQKLSEANIQDYYIIRYRDDYRIFVNNPTVGDAVTKYLTEVLIELGLKLNSTKTSSSRNIILGSIKKDKLDLTTSLLGEK